MKTRLVRLAILLFLILNSTGCILTLGAPLTRKVQPDSWVLEAAVGGSNFGGACGYAYAGKSLGSHFEIGLLPYAYQFANDVAAAITVPLRWDPFPNEWPFHLVPFVAPTLFGGNVSGAGLTVGLGTLWQPFSWLELYAVGSTLIPNPALFTVAGGARGLIGSWQVGATGMYTYPGYLSVFVTAGLLLSGH